MIIYSDNLFSGAFVSLVTSTLDVGDKNLATFLIEGNYVDKTLLDKLMQCSAERILVLTQSKAYRLFLISDLSEKIYIGHYGSSLGFIRKTIINFVNDNGFNTKCGYFKKAGRVYNRLSPREKMVVSSLSHGMSTYTLSRLCKVTIKTISSQKRRAMEKMGSNNNAELLNDWRMLNAINSTIVNKHSLIPFNG